MDPIFSAGFTMPETAPKPGGMFGGGGDWRSALMAAGAALMARRNPQASAMLSNMLQMKQHQAMEEQQYQRERHDKRDDFTFEQDYRAAHDTPPSTEYERALAAAGIQPGSPEYVEHMKSFVNMRENPPFTYVDPATGAVMMGARTAPAQPEILHALPPGSKPIGGAGSPAPRPFPY